MRQRRFHIGLLSACVEFGLCTSNVPAQVPCRYDVSAIIQGPNCGITGPAGAFGTGISPNGRWVCGYYPVCDGSAHWRAFLFDTQTQQFTTLPLPPGATTTYAWDVNDTPWVVGTSGKGFVYDFNAGQYIALIPALAPNGSCDLNAINANGVACGTRTIQNSPNRTNAIIWSLKSGVTDLGLVNGLNTSGVDLNDNGSVTGTMVVNGVTTPFLWHHGEFTSLETLAGLNSAPQAIADDAEIVGSSLVPNPNPPPSSNHHAFAWSQGTIRDLGTLPGYTRSEALAMGPNGLIVGWSLTPSVDYRAVIWYQRAIIDLTPQTTLPSGSFLEIAVGISQIGTLVVDGRYLGQSATFILVPIDSPPQGDITDDCRVGMDDLLLVINEWALTNSPADITDDQIVNVDDLMIVIENWTY